MTSHTKTVDRSQFQDNSLDDRLDSPPTPSRSESPSSDGTSKRQCDLTTTVVSDAEKKRRQEFAGLMMLLTGLKRTAQMDKHQLRAHYKILGIFSMPVINRAVLELTLSDSRFPDIGDLYQCCRRHAIKADEMKEPYCPNGDPKKDRQITNDEIHTIGSALGLETRNPNQRKAVE